MTKAQSELAVKNADQIEQLAFLEGNCPYIQSTSDDEMAKDANHFVEESGNSTPDGMVLPPEYQMLDDARENAVSDAVGELRRRCDLLKDHYPFELGRAHLEHRPKSALNTGIYEFCLAFSVTQNDISAKPFVEAEREFERLVGYLLCAFWGKNAKYYRFGAAVDEGESGKLSGRLAKLHQLTDVEFNFTPPHHPDAPDDPLHPEQGDGGIDVVVWKSIGDRRSGTPIILSQCACGEWKHKRKELDPEAFNDNWNGQISLGRVYLRSMAIPHMAIPHHVAHDSEWHTSVSEAGLFLDRTRLTLMGETHLADDQKVELRAKLEALTKLLNSTPQPVSKKPSRSKPRKPRNPKS